VSEPSHYSEHGQDEWVKSLFPGKRDGFFIEAGAMDGRIGSNTYWLERLGWQGICIEGNPAWFPELPQYRTCTCLHCCLAGSRRQVTFRTPDAKNGWGGIEEHLLPAVREACGVGPIFTVDGIPLADVLREHNAPHVIEYLSLDVEGGELEILESFPFDEFRILAITVETPYCNELLQQRGYIIDRMLGADFCFVWPSLIDKAKGLSQP
jgi:FkbM family methyltransferase